MPTDRELDQMIDAALSSYSATEARSGLEQRVLHHALAETRHKRNLFWAWALAIPATACLLVALFFAARHNSHRNTLEATATNAPAPTVPSPHQTPATNSIPSPQKRSIPHRVSAQPSSTHETLPKEDVFPSPSPLTAEERAAIALVRVRTAPMPQQSDRAARVEIDPIHIAELQIKPIAPPDDLPNSLATESSMNALQP
jgi:hypothetical protein